jgi:hypothetical protein
MDLMGQLRLAGIITKTNDYREPKPIFLTCLYAGLNPLILFSFQSSLQRRIIAKWQSMSEQHTLAVRYTSYD